MKIGGSIFGGLSASKAMKNVKKNLENQQRENRDLYDRRYNEDATQRADAQRVLAMTEQSIRRSMAAPFVFRGVEKRPAPWNLFIR